MNISDISRSLGVSTPTISRYLDILEGSFLIHRLQPYYINIGKRLVKAPKFYFRDSGVFHALASIDSAERLVGHRSFGASWEGYVVEQIRRSAPERWQFFFYRTHTGAEADMVLQSTSGNLYLVEIKFSLSTNISKGFFQSAADLQPAGKYVIVADVEQYPRADGTIVCSLKAFLSDILPFLI